MEKFAVLWYIITENERLRGNGMLQTKRLYLRNLRPGDEETMFSYRNDSRCNAFQRYSDTSIEGLRRFVEEFENSTFLSCEAEQHYAVICGEAGAMAGDITVFFTEKDNCFTLGITIAPCFQRQGFAYEILGEVISRIQNKYPSADIVALIEKENIRSIALFKKLGFVEECYSEKIQSYVFTIFGMGTSSNNN